MRQTLVKHEAASASAAVLKPAHKAAMQMTRQIAANKTSGEKDLPGDEVLRAILRASR
ncbi:MAG: hypothetical protein JNM65_06215 [Verrucomicrobiaceae bacterium]|nr:hypothetical protein [Verrucomicrobiaceae bacterium]